MVVPVFLLLLSLLFSDFVCFALQHRFFVVTVSKLLFSPWNAVGLRQVRLLKQFARVRANANKTNRAPRSA